MKESIYGEVDLTKLAGLATNLGGIGVCCSRLGREENFKYPLCPDEEEYAVVDPRTSEIVGVITPWGACTEMESFRIYLLYPFVKNVERRNQPAIQE
jgi:hypothetical protein